MTLNSFFILSPLNLTLCFPRFIVTYVSFVFRGSFNFSIQHIARSFKTNYLLSGYKWLFPITHLEIESSFALIFSLFSSISLWWNVAITKCSKSKVQSRNSKINNTTNKDLYKNKRQDHGPWRGEHPLLTGYNRRVLFVKETENSVDNYWLGEYLWSNT